MTRRTLRDSPGRVCIGLVGIALVLTATVPAVATPAVADPGARAERVIPPAATDIDAPPPTGRHQVDVPTHMSPGPARPGALLWEDRVDAGGFGQFFSASAAKGRVYAAGFTFGPRGRDSLVRAYDARRGTVLWESSLDRAGDDFVSGVMAAGDAIVVSGTARRPGTGYDWTLRAYDALTGALRWENTFDLAGGSDFSRGTALSVRSGRVFVGGYGTTSSGYTDWVVRAHDVSSGAILWQDVRDVSGRDDGAYSLTASDDSVFVGGWGDSAGSGNAVIRALDPASGALRWEAFTPGVEDFSFTKKVVTDGDNVYAAMQLFDAGTQAIAGPVRAYDGQTGAALWRSPASDGNIRYEDIAVAGGRVVAVGQAGPECIAFSPAESDCEAVVSSIAASSGDVRWERLLRLSGGDDLAARVITHGATVFVSGDVNAIHPLVGCCVMGRWFVQAFRHDSGATLWRHVGGDVESGVYNMTIDQNRLFVPGRAVDLADDVWSPILRGYDARGRVGETDSVPPIVPGALELTGTAGTTSFDAVFDGTLTGEVHGLSPADVQPGVVADDPANDIGTALGTGVGLTEHTINVPAGTEILQVSLFDEETDGNDDLDLYVFDSDFDFVGASGSITSEEQVRLVDPAPGDYYVFVHGYETDGADASYSLFSWAVADDQGNLVVTLPPPGGPSGTVTLGWSGLAPGSRYLGVVSFSDGTFVVPTAVYVVP